MFAFFRRSRPAPARRQPKRRFRVEALEGRNLLTAMGVMLTAETSDAHNVMVSGEVQFFNSPSVCSIVLSGEVTANLTTDDNGNFEYYGPAGGLGMVMAQATDSGGTQVEGYAQISDPQPQINGLTIEATGQGKQVEITGSVSAGDVAGLTVNFSGSLGLVVDTATTDANGDFDLITTASTLGELEAVVTDVWGTESGPATTQFTVPPPSLSPLVATDMGNGIYNFQGTVSGPDAGDDTVQFSGITNGTAGVNASGSFAKELLLNSDHPSGDEYAVATDIWGQQSNQVVSMFFGG